MPDNPEFVKKPMTFDEYGQFTVDLWVSGGALASDITHPKNLAYKDAAERNMAIMSLGLAGETGEVVEKIKKLLRDGTYDEEGIIKELGDVVYYWARLCRFFGKNPSDIIAANVVKLTSRRDRGVLRGSGDNR